MVARARIALAVLALVAGSAAAQPTAEILRQGNEAASAGDWPRVAALVDPLVRVQLPAGDRAEAYRLAGLAAFFQKRTADADAYFLAYLRLDLDAQLDPALYPPDVVTFFNDVKVRHAGELRARRPKSRRYWVLNFLPPAGQVQNGENRKAIILGGALGVFAIGNVTTFLVLRSWCTRVFGDAGQSATCDEPRDRASAASTVRGLNIVTGVGLIATYVYGVYDGVSGYRRQSRERAQPYVMTTANTAVVGIGGTF